jgi:hypothetical protein
MPPKTRQTPEQVAASRELRNVQWERATGIDLLTDEQYRQRIGGRRLASVLPKMLQRYGLRGGR